ncbi:sugar ABC transporter substrate-binding protein [Marinoscillum sp. MHG1-6]|uniref:sugar ABC transporter substrate-binding protein n=1 Tax=Marinoscillum sp. MHG1-6 TaxID=2959627 RepID=UPI0021577288|nr:substrate-binding domain-containing protein [Marinoscillum sp. MHG1-6]
MKTPTLSVILVMAIALIFTACDSRPAKDQSKRATVGISLGPADGRWAKDRDYLMSNLESKGAKVYVREAKDDVATQKDDIRYLISEKIDVMIVVPIDGESLSELVTEARSKGVKVVAYDRLIPNCNLDFYVSFDNFRVGEMQAEYLTRVIPEGNYMVLGGSPTDLNSKFLRLGQMNILQPLITKGDINLIYDTDIDNWNTELAFQKVNEFLKKSETKPDAILASSDNLSIGAIQALDRHGLTGKVIVSGQDAQEDACRRILEGSQIMTVYKIIESLAHTAANVSLALAKNEVIPDSHLTISNGKMMVPSILLSSMISVNKENLRMTVIADGYLDESKVYDSSMVVSEE